MPVSLSAIYMCDTMGGHEDSSSWRHKQIAAMSIKLGELRCLCQGASSFTLPLLCVQSSHVLSLPRKYKCFNGRISASNVVMDWAMGGCLMIYMLEWGPVYNHRSIYKGCMWQASCCSIRSYLLVDNVWYNIELVHEMFMICLVLLWHKRITIIKWQAMVKDDGLLRVLVW